MSPDYGGPGMERGNLPARRVDRKGNAAGGMFFIVLLVVFVVLKLSPPVPEWSWWAVSAPLWAPLAIAALIAFGKAMQS